MRQKIKNTLSIVVEGVDLNTVTNIEFYVRQGNVFFQLSPTILNESEMIVVVPKEKADSLNTNSMAYLQFAFTDKDGNDIASDITEVEVGRLLKSEGYDGD